MKTLRNISKKIAQIQALFILTIIYILFVPFFVLLFRYFKGKTRSKTAWSSWKNPTNTMHDLKRQF